jgi:hypothetical protein
MVLELKPETERLLREELSKGHFESIDEIILRGINTRLGSPVSDRPTARTAIEAAARMRASRTGNKLPPGMTLKELIEEGRD